MRMFYVDRPAASGVVSRLPVRPGPAHPGRLVTPDLIVRLQRSVGNAAVARMLQAGGVPLQRHAGAGEELDESAVQRLPAGPGAVVQRHMHDRYDRQWTWAQQQGVLSASQIALARAHVTKSDPKDEVLKVVTMSNILTKVVKDKNRRRQIQALVWKHLVEHNFDIQAATAYKGTLTQADKREVAEKVGTAASSARLRSMGGTIYRDPPLDGRDGRMALGRFALGDVTALGGLKGATEVYGMDETYESPIEHEWGLGEAKDGSGECFIIVGDTTGVDWGNYLPFLTPIAHAHPYFGKTPAAFGAPGTAGTKVIGGGGFTINTLNGISGQAEALKVLPSAGDVKFCADKGFATHTVYTPYVYVDNPEPAIINPSPRVAAAPRVEFDIQNAAATGTAGQYTCRIVASAANAVIWQKDVTADTATGGGGLGTLTW